MIPPWSEELAAHLLRRAAFGGSPAEVARAMEDGCEATVERLLLQADARIEGSSLSSLQRSWIARMLRTSQPLAERMTFFWHDHFATSIVAVRHPALMQRQNDLFRAGAFGNVRDLTLAVARDPAMLLWLDNYLSGKERPNENFGRELLELLLLGIGNYGEDDVRAAVRAFTGWTLTSTEADARFVFDPELHDAAAGRAEDLVRSACRQPAHARFIVTKLFAFFAYDEPEPDVVERLAKIYLDHDAEVAPLLRAILTSPEMYSPRALWSAVKSPLDHAIIACRQLQAAVDPAEIVAALDAQGLSLFNPPDIAGWKSGMRWISSSTLLARMRLAGIVASRCDPALVAAGGTSVDFWLRRLGPIPVAEGTRRQLGDAAARGGARAVIRMILSGPEWQRN